MFLATALGLALTIQVTPDHLEKSRAMRKSGPATRAAGDPDGRKKHVFGMPMGGRIREFDLLINDYGAASIGWPHKLDGKTYGELDGKGREKLMALQMKWVDSRDGYPDASMAGQYNNPSSRFHAERRRRAMAAMRKNNMPPSPRQPK
jgi:hypothetical protein